jgi:hypothetical protein
MGHRGQQVDWWARVGAAAAQGLAVHGDRLPPGPGRRRWGGCWGLLAGQPGADGVVQRIRVDAGQHPAHGGLAGWAEGAGQGVAADPQRGQHPSGRVSGPLPDRGQRPRAGQHRGDRHGQHRDQRIPAATTAAGIGDLGEGIQQATALVGRQHGGRGRLLGSRRDRA